uniref:Uncharacterized protein n=1 Tax=Meloidogyne enterolobii TaxID=390850 RepID=A0A6V7WE45_MELEN|nr:unnamed protein product [Meloidogyne enterolobii]
MIKVLNQKQYTRAGTRKFRIGNLAGMRDYSRVSYSNKVFKNYSVIYGSPQM